MKTVERWPSLCDQCLHRAGSGIGLPLVQELVKLHCGTVRVESELDRGSTFIVTILLGKDHLPIERIGAARSLDSTRTSAEAYVQASAQDISDDVEIAPCASTKAAFFSQENRSQPIAHVLLADDNADMRRYVEKLLNAQYEVVPCEDGQVALERTRQTHPDLVLSDVMMPRMDGFGLLRQLREDKDLRDVPVILLTARAGEESCVEGLDAGADDYLIKPFSARELMARVGSHLTMAKIRREAAELKCRNVEMFDEIKTLRGVVLICSYCRKVETNPATWIDLENYVRRHSDAEFNHGVCPDCLRKASHEMSRS